MALVIFFICYLLFVLFNQWRSFIAVCGACALVLLQIVTLETAVTELVYWNVIGLFFGTLILAELFMQSRMPAVIAEWFVDQTSSARGALITICLLSSLLSAFVENVAVVLIVAPIALTLCQKLHISPVKPLIFLAMFSNVQGTATLIGDPPSMILGGYMKMTFNDFFFYHGRPSIFFIIQIGALAATVLVFYLLKEFKQKTKLIRIEKTLSYVPSGLLIVFVCILATASYIDPDFKWFAGTVAMLLAIIGLIWYTFGPHWTPLTTLIRELDWDTTFFLTGLFVVVGALEKTGWITSLAEWMSPILEQNLLAAFILVIGFSVLFSAFIDNVPYLLTMIPVIQGASSGSESTLVLLIFALLIGACLGGNITPIGASANIVAVGILKKEGHEISFGHYVKYGLAFTAVAVFASSAALWFLFSQ